MCKLVRLRRSRSAAIFVVCLAVILSQQIRSSSTDIRTSINAPVQVGHSGDDTGIYVNKSNEVPNSLEKRNVKRKHVSDVKFRSGGGTHSDKRNGGKGMPVSSGIHITGKRNPLANISKHSETKISGKRSDDDAVMKGTETHIVGKRDMGSVDEINKRLKTHNIGNHGLGNTIKSRIGKHTGKKDEAILKSSFPDEKRIQEPKHEIENPSIESDYRNKLDNILKNIEVNDKINDKAEIDGKVKDQTHIPDTDIIDELADREELEYQRKMDDIVKKQMVLEEVPPKSDQILQKFRANTDNGDTRENKIKTENKVNEETHIADDDIIDEFANREEREYQNKMEDIVKKQMVLKEQAHLTSDQRRDKTRIFTKEGNTHENKIKIDDKVKYEETNTADGDIIDELGDREGREYQSKMDDIVKKQMVSKEKLPLKSYQTRQSIKTNTKKGNTNEESHIPDDDIVDGLVDREGRKFQSKMDDILRKQMVSKEKVHLKSDQTSEKIRAKPGGRNTHEDEIKAIISDLIDDQSNFKHNLEKSKITAEKLKHELFEIQNRQRDVEEKIGSAIAENDDTKRALLDLSIDNQFVKSKVADLAKGTVTKETVNKAMKQSIDRAVETVKSDTNLIVSGLVEALDNKQKEQNDGSMTKSTKDLTTRKSFRNHRLKQLPIQNHKPASIDGHERHRFNLNNRNLISINSVTGRSEKPRRERSRQRQQPQHHFDKLKHANRHRNAFRSQSHVGSNGQRLRHRAILKDHQIDKNQYDLISPDISNSLKVADNPIDINVGESVVVDRKTYDEWIKDILQELDEGYRKPNGFKKKRISMSESVSQQQPIHQSQQAGSDNTQRPFKHKLNVENEHWVNGFVGSIYQDSESYLADDQNDFLTMTEALRPSNYIDDDSISNSHSNFNAEMRSRMKEYHRWPKPELNLVAGKEKDNGAVISDQYYQDSTITNRYDIADDLENHWIDSVFQRGHVNENDSTNIDIARLANAIGLGDDFLRQTKDSSEYNDVFLDDLGDVIHTGEDISENSAKEFPDRENMKPPSKVISTSEPTQMKRVDTHTNGVHQKNDRIVQNGVNRHWLDSTMDVVPSNDRLHIINKEDTDFLDTLEDVMLPEVAQNTEYTSTIQSNTKLPVVSTTAISTFETLTVPNIDWIETALDIVPVDLTVMIARSLIEYILQDKKLLNTHWDWDKERISRLVSILSSMFNSMFASHNTITKTMPDVSDRIAKMFLSYIEEAIKLSKNNPANISRAMEDILGRIDDILVEGNVTIGAHKVAEKQSFTEANAMSSQHMINPVIWLNNLTDSIKDNTNKYDTNSNANIFKNLTLETLSKLNNLIKDINYYSSTPPQTEDQTATASPEVSTTDQWFEHIATAISNQNMPTLKDHILKQFQQIFQNTKASSIIAQNVEDEALLNDLLGVVAPYPTNVANANYAKQTQSSLVSTQKPTEKSKYMQWANQFVKYLPENNITNVLREKVLETLSKLQDLLKSSSNKTLVSFVDQYTSKPFFDEPTSENTVEENKLELTAVEPITIQSNISGRLNLKNDKNEALLNGMIGVVAPYNTEMYHDQSELVNNVRQTHASLESTPRPTGEPNYRHWAAQLVESLPKYIMENDENNVHHNGSLETLSNLRDLLKSSSNKTLVSFVDQYTSKSFFDESTSENTVEENKLELTAAEPITIQSDNVGRLNPKNEALLNDMIGFVAPYTTEMYQSEPVNDGRQTHASIVSTQRPTEESNYRHWAEQFVESLPKNIMDNDKKYVHDNDTRKILSKLNELIKSSSNESLITFIDQYTINPILDKVASENAVEEYKLKPTVTEPITATDSKKVKNKDILNHVIGAPYTTGKYQSEAVSNGDYVEQTKSSLASTQKPTEESKYLHWANQFVHSLPKNYRKNYKEYGHHDDNLETLSRIKDLLDSTSNELLVYSNDKYTLEPLLGEDTSENNVDQDELKQITATEPMTTKLWINHALHVVQNEGKPLKFTNEDLHPLSILDVDQTQTYSSSSENNQLLDELNSLGYTTKAETAIETTLAVPGDTMETNSDKIPNLDIIDHVKEVIGAPYTTGKYQSEVVSNGDYIKQTKSSRGSTQKPTEKSKYLHWANHFVNSLPKNYMENDKKYGLHNDTLEILSRIKDLLESTSNELLGSSVDKYALEPLLDEATSENTVDEDELKQITKTEPMTTKLNHALHAVQHEGKSHKFTNEDLHSLNMLDIDQTQPYSSSSEHEQLLDELKVLGYTTKAETVETTLALPGGKIENNDEIPNLDIIDHIKDIVNAKSMKTASKEQNEQNKYQYVLGNISKLLDVEHATIDSMISTSVDNNIQITSTTQVHVHDYDNTINLPETRVYDHETLDASANGLTTDYISPVAEVATLQIPENLTATTRLVDDNVLKVDHAQDVTLPTAVPTPPTVLETYVRPFQSITSTLATDADIEANTARSVVADFVETDNKVSDLLNAVTTNGQFSTDSVVHPTSAKFSSTLVQPAIIPSSTTNPTTTTSSIRNTMGKANVNIHNKVKQDIALDITNIEPIHVTSQTITYVTNTDRPVHQYNILTTDASSDIISNSGTEGTDDLLETSSLSTAVITKVATPKQIVGAPSYITSHLENPSRNSELIIINNEDNGVHLQSQTVLKSLADKRNRRPVNARFHNNGVRLPGKGPFKPNIIKPSIGSRIRDYKDGFYDGFRMAIASNIGFKKQLQNQHIENQMPRKIEPVTQFQIQPKNLNDVEPVNNVFIKNTIVAAPDDVKNKEKQKYKNIDTKEDHSTEDTQKNPPFTDWERWSPCTVSCGRGHMTRHRACRVRGLCQGKTTESKACTIQPTCQVFSWEEWTPWSACSVTCGLGLVNRRRSCLNRSGVDQRTCDGPDADSRECFHVACENRTYTRFKGFLVAAPFITLVMLAIGIMVTKQCNKRKNVTHTSTNHQKRSTARQQETHGTRGYFTNSYSDGDHGPKLKEYVKKSRRKGRFSDAENLKSSRILKQNTSRSETENDNYQGVDTRIHEDLQRLAVTRDSYFSKGERNRSNKQGVKCESKMGQNIFKFQKYVPTTRHPTTYVHKNYPRGDVMRNEQGFPTETILYSDVKMLPSSKKTSRSRTTMFEIDPFENRTSEQRAFTMPKDPSMKSAQIPHRDFRRSDSLIQHMPPRNKDHMTRSLKERTNSINSHISVPNKHSRTDICSLPHENAVDIDRPTLSSSTQRSSQKYPKGSDTRFLPIGTKDQLFQACDQTTYELNTNSYISPFDVDKPPLTSSSSVKPSQIRAKIYANDQREPRVFALPKDAFRNSDTTKISDNNYRRSDKYIQHMPTRKQDYWTRSSNKQSNQIISSVPKIHSHADICVLSPEIGRSQDTQNSSTYYRFFQTSQKGLDSRLLSLAAKDPQSQASHQEIIIPSRSPTNSDISRHDVNKPHIPSSSLKTSQRGAMTYASDQTEPRGYVMQKNVSRKSAAGQIHHDLRRADNIIKHMPPTTDDCLARSSHEQRRQIDSPILVKNEHLTSDICRLPSNTAKKQTSQASKEQIINEIYPSVSSTNADILYPVDASIRKSTLYTPVSSTLSHNSGKSLHPMESQHTTEQQLSHIKIVENGLQVSSRRSFEAPISNHAFRRSDTLIQDIPPATSGCLTHTSYEQLNSTISVPNKYSHVNGRRLIPETVVDTGNFSTHRVFQKSSFEGSRHKSAMQRDFIINPIHHDSGRSSHPMTPIRTSDQPSEQNDGKNSQISVGKQNFPKTSTPNYVMHKRTTELKPRSSIPEAVALPSDKTHSLKTQKDEIKRNRSIPCLTNKPGSESHHDLCNPQSNVSLTTQTRHNFCDTALNIVPMTPQCHSITCDRIQSDVAFLSTERNHVHKYFDSISDLSNDNDVSNESDCYFSVPSSCQDVSQTIE